MISLSARIIAFLKKRTEFWKVFFVEMLIIFAETSTGNVLRINKRSA